MGNDNAAAETARTSSFQPPSAGGEYRHVTDYAVADDTIERTTPLHTQIHKQESEGQFFRDRRHADDPNDYLVYNRKPACSATDTDGEATSTESPSPSHPTISPDGGRFLVRLRRSRAEERFSTKWHGGRIMLRGKGTPSCRDLEDRWVVPPSPNRRATPQRVKEGPMPPRDLLATNSWSTSRDRR